VAWTGDRRRADKVLVGRPYGNRTFGKLVRRWEDNIKMDLKDVRWESKEWIDLAQKRDRWRALVNAVMNLRVIFIVAPCILDIFNLLHNNECTVITV
jgi:hypothetical protein